jgi:plasmid stabilization system protein ParE
VDERGLEQAWRETLMSLTLRYTEEVFCDIQEIRCQLSRYESSLGDRFAHAAYRTFAWIAANPAASRVRSEYKPDGIRLRAVIGFPSYLIFYLVDDDHVTIWRVLHGSRDLSQILKD